MGAKTDLTKKIIKIIVDEILNLPHGKDMESKLGENFCEI